MTLAQALRKGLEEQGPIEGEVWIAIFEDSSQIYAHLETVAYTEKGCREAVRSIRQGASWKKANRWLGVRRFRFIEAAEGGGS